MTIHDDSLKLIYLKRFQLWKAAFVAASVLSEPLTMPHFLRPAFGQL